MNSEAEKRSNMTMVAGDAGGVQASVGATYQLSSFPKIVSEGEFNAKIDSFRDVTAVRYYKRAKTLIIRGFLLNGRDAKPIPDTVSEEIIAGSARNEARVFLVRGNREAQLLWKGPKAEYGENYRRIRDRLCGPVRRQPRGRAANPRIIVHDSSLERTPCRRDGMGGTPCCGQQTPPGQKGHLQNGVDEAWRHLCAELGKCRDCWKGALLHPSARPLFGRFRPRLGGVLFVFEAPNLADTTDPKKGYLTYDPATDQTGKFTHELVTEILGLSIDEFQVTNAVLCLPAAKQSDGGTAYPVSNAQVRMCSKNIHRQVELLDPRVVVSVGRRALIALHKVESHPYRTMKEAVARPVEWADRWLFPLFHTSQQGRNGPSGRKPEDQRDDWRKLRAFLMANAVIGSVAE